MKPALMGSLLIGFGSCSSFPRKRESSVFRAGTGVPKAKSLDERTCVREKDARFRGNDEPRQNDEQQP